MKSKLLYALLLVGLMTGNCYAVELVCKGSRPENPQQRPIFVDCSNRKAVIDTLGAAWNTLRKQGVIGMDTLCSKPYEQATSLHPSIQINDIAVTFFESCNMALEDIK